MTLGVRARACIGRKGRKVGSEVAKVQLDVMVLKQLEPRAARRRRSES